MEGHKAHLRCFQTSDVFCNASSGKCWACGLAGSTSQVRCRCDLSAVPLALKAVVGRPPRELHSHYMQANVIDALG